MEELYSNDVNDNIKFIYELRKQYVQVLLCISPISTISLAEWRNRDPCHFHTPHKINKFTFSLIINN